MTWPEELEFWVDGTPIPQGSKGARTVRGKAHLFDTNAKHLHPWRKHVTETARGQDVQFGSTPVSVALDFYFEPPLKPKFPAHAVKPDADKLTRAILDSLTNAEVFKDDCLATRLIVEKHYGDYPGVNIRVRRLDMGETPDPGMGDMAD